MEPSSALPGGPPESIPESYLWKADGQPYAVSIEFDVIDRLTPEVSEAFRALRRRGAEVGGILLGRVTPATAHAPGLIRILDYVAVPCERRYGPSYVLSESDYERFDKESAKWRHRAGGLTLVGFYRSNTRETMRLTAEDQGLLDTRFPDAESVALLIKPSPDRAFEATFLLRQNGQFPAEPIGPVFAFRRKDLGGGISPEFTPHPGLPEIPEPTSARNRMLSSQLDQPHPITAPVVEPPRAAAPPSPPPIVPAPPPTPVSTPAAHPPVAEAAPYPAIPPPIRAKTGLPIWLTLFLCLLFGAGGAGAGYFFAANKGNDGRILLPGNDAAAGGAQVLGLSSATAGEDLVFQWDTRSAAFRDGQKAVATIEDGDNLKTIEMDASALSKGRLLYRPVSRQIAFRLDIFTTERSGVTESLVVTRP